MTPQGPEISVFVHLATGFGRQSWRDRWQAGKLIGINHQDPYGYRQACEMGCEISQSEDYPENAASRFLRLGLRAVLGFDLVHAWRNRKGIFASEVVWTHTESQALAILALTLFHDPKARPRLIAQTIWVMDDWSSYSVVRRAFYRYLLRRADVLTVHSSSALRQLKQIFPTSRCELVRYGIRADQTLRRAHRPMHWPLRVLTLGNDRHRDWRTFIAAVRNCSDLEARIVTGTDISKLIDEVSNVTLAQVKQNDDLIGLYCWADIVVVCLTDNLHASGITVIQESVLFGVPVICSDTGDLRSYFTGEEVLYVKPQDVQALRDAIEYAYHDQEASRERSSRALLRMTRGDINSYQFVAQHVQLSREILNRASWEIRKRA